MNTYKNACFRNIYYYIKYTGKYIINILSIWLYNLYIILNTYFDIIYISKP